MLSLLLVVFGLIKEVVFHKRESLKHFGEKWSYESASKSISMLLIKIISISFCHDMAKGVTEITTQN